MPHDKISAAARRRMAETGEPYAAARREVLREHQAAAGEVPPPEPRWFAISYRERGLDRVTAWGDRFLFHAGPGVSGVEIGSGEVRVRMGSFRLDIPRDSVRSVRRSHARVWGASGVHGGRGRWLVNGSPEGLVELALDPPSDLAPGIDTLFRREKVSLLIVSLVDPDGFVAAFGPDGRA
jgi:hypothetical protein